MRTKSPASTHSDMNDHLNTTTISNGSTNKGRRKRKRSTKPNITSNTTPTNYNDNTIYDNNDISNIDINQSDDDDIEVDPTSTTTAKDKKEKTECELLWDNLDWDIDHDDENNIDQYIYDNIDGYKEYIETYYKLDHNNNDVLVSKKTPMPIGIHMLNTFAIKYPPACQCIKETLKSRKRKPSIGSNVLELLTFRGGPDEESHAIIQSRAGLVQEELEKKYYHEYYYDYENDRDKDEKALREKLKRKSIGTIDNDGNSDNDTSTPTTKKKTLPVLLADGHDSNTATNNNDNHIANTTSTIALNIDRSSSTSSSSPLVSSIVSSSLSLPQSIISSSWPMLKKYYNNDKLNPNTTNTTDTNDTNDTNDTTSNCYFTNRPYMPPKLGKRGRPYKDMWDEAEAISEHDLPFTTVNDFSEILNGYCDNHDGSYREYMLNMIDVQLRDELKKSAKHRNASNDTIICVNPPVPVAQHHPAAWGLNARRKDEDFLNFIESNTNNNADESKLPQHIYEYVHPACVSNTIIVQSTSLTDHNEDCDELNLAAEYCYRELKMQETLNVIRLEHVKKTSMMMSKVTKIRNKKNMVSDVLSIARKIIAVRSKVAQNFPYIFFPSDNTDDIVDTNADPNITDGNVEYNSNDFTPNKDITTNDEPNMVNKGRYSTRTSSGTIRPKRIDDDEYDHQDVDVPYVSNSNAAMGACLIDHVPHGQFILKLKPNDKTEVLIKETWCMGTVKKVQKDDAMAVRHIKVKPFDSHPSESVWVSVDDGRLAPPGTNINCLFSKYLKRSN